MIFLTARDTPEDELLAFGVDGDDFIRKPHNSAVLLARIARILKTTVNDSPTVRGLTLGLPGMKAIYGGNPSNLRRKLRRADNLTETILTYGKIQTVEKDTRISLTYLRTTWALAVREETALLIAVVSSVAFAAGHLAVGNAGLVAYDITTVFIDSMIYAVVYRRSGNCLMSTISHILCNAVAIAATLLFF